MFADRLLLNEEMPAKPDLTSHTMTHFLDRFVYRNAKAAAGAPRGTSIMQPLAGGDSRGLLVSNRSTGKGQAPVNTEAFWRKKAADVAVDEVFFHQYFNQIGKGKQASDKKKLQGKKKDSAGSEDDEEENEDEIWQALVDSRPEVEGPGDDESDLEMLDLDDYDDASSDADEGAADDDIVEDESDEEDMGMLDDGEDDAMFDSEDEVPADVDEMFRKELETNQPEQASGDGEESKSKKRKKLKNLPTFASADDYAAMLEDDKDED